MMSKSHCCASSTDKLQHLLRLTILKLQYKLFSTGFLLLKADTLSLNKCFLTDINNYRRLTNDALLHDNANWPIYCSKSEFVLNTGSLERKEKVWFNIRIIDLPLREHISNLPHISDFFTFHSLVCGKYEYFTSILRSPDTIWPLSENGRCSTISSKFRNKPKQKLLAQGNSLIFEGLFGGVYFLRVLYPEGRTFRILRNAEEDRCQVVVLTNSFFLLTALTIRCYECAPNFSSVSGANMCNNPVDAITCTDPSQDSCFSISLTGHTGNTSDFAKFTFPSNVSSHAHIWYVTWPQ